MATTLPIYQERGRTYRADTCGPVERAVAAGQVRFAAVAHGHYPGCKLPRGTLPGVKSVGFWDAEAQQDWGLDWHRNEGIEITLLERGAIGFAVEQREFRLRPGALTVTRPWQRHRVGDPHVGAGRLHWLILDVGVRRPHQTWRWPPWLILTPPDRERLTDVLRHNEQPVWQADAEIRQCFQRIAAAVETDASGRSASRLAVEINHLFVLMLAMFQREHVALDPSLSSSVRTVELFWADLRDHREHLALEWTVGRMAQRCGLGVTRFIHHSTQLNNRTPMRYLNHCRLEAAGDLLREQPTMSVTQVAMACGFSSSQYFATAFGRHFGVSPQTYRDSPSAK